MTVDGQPTEAAKQRAQVKKRGEGKALCLETCCDYRADQRLRGCAVCWLPDSLDQARGITCSSRSLPPRRADMCAVFWPVFFVSSSPDWQNALLKEVGLLGKLMHPNLVRFCGVCLDPPLVVMEYYRFGSVYKMLESARAAVAQGRSNRVSCACVEVD